MTLLCASQLIYLRDTAAPDASMSGVQERLLSSKLKTKSACLQYMWLLTDGRKRRFTTGKIILRFSPSIYRRLKTT
jgi:hypothetical protein